MPDLEPLLDGFVQACRDIFGEENIEGIILHGSAVKGGVIPGYSDIDFMVFLTPNAFEDSGRLSDEAAFTMQERIGPMPWREAGFGYPQAYFYDARRLPEWWTGPVPGAFRALVGELPDAAKATEEGLRSGARRFLSETLPGRLNGMVSNYADSADEQLPRRVRLLGTDLTPAVLSLASLHTDDLLALWGKTKLQALAIIEKAYPDADGPAFAKHFYEQVERLFGGDFDVALGRDTFRTGVAFMRWAEEIGRSLD
jgi:hypothetical protein